MLRPSAHLQVAWRGVLYITDRHSCWKADADSTTLMLPHSDVASVEKTEQGAQAASPLLCHRLPCATVPSVRSTAAMPEAIQAWVSSKLHFASE